MFKERIIPKSHIWSLDY